MRYAFIPFLMLASINAFAANIPPALQYKGQPIDALCFYELEKNPVSLTQCGIKSETDRKKAGQNSDLVNKGYVGYDYIWPMGNGNDSANAYSYYKVLGKVDNRYILHTVNGTGGSGDFTAVAIVTRDGDKLNVKTVTSGDRCNGGVHKGEVRKNILYFDVNITPFDYIELAGQNPHELKAYDDLAACAACCLGVAKYSMDLNTDKGEPKLEMIDFGESVKPNSQGQGKYELCFEKLVAEYQAQGKKQISPHQLEGLIKEFNTKCFAT